MAANAREARRRKILERGSDRLALITGQIQSLPSSSKPLISNDQLLQTHGADQATVPHDNDDTADSASQYCDPTVNGSSLSPLLSKGNANEAAVARASKDRNTQSPPVPSEGEDSPQSTLSRDHLYKQRIQPRSSFSLNQISTAVSDSEKTRLCCSATIASLVVISYIGLPFIGQSFMRMVFGFRPLYLVLLTNVSVVIGRLLFTKQKVNRATVSGESQVRATEGQSSAEQIGKVLEAGLGIQKVVDAIFMDFSVFAVIIIFGLSILQQFRN